MTPVGSQPAGPQQSTAFTSDLSVADFALCQQLDVEPLAQVMGSSIYQVGYETATWPTAFGGYMVEIDVLSQAWNEVRELALGRLAKESARVGADAVIGVDIRTGSHDFAEGAIEQIVIGTAVRHRRENGRPTSGPVLTELSVADYAKLSSAGFQPLGLVAWSSVFFVMANSEVQAMGGLSGKLLFPENQELTHYTRGIYQARELVVGRMSEQASGLGADGVIGTRIAHGISARTIQRPGYSREGLMVTFHAIGTAITQHDDAIPHPPETAIDLTA